MDVTTLRKSVKTVVVVLMENRSFDHILGHLSLLQFGGRADVDGVRSLEDSVGNPSSNNVVIYPFLGNDGPLPNDLPHERPFVAQQIAFAPVAGDFTMTGFVKAYEDFTGTSGVTQPPPMMLLTPKDLPISSFFAKQYLVCNRWFAPLPASTQPNRLMAMSGYTLMDTTKNGLLPNQKLVFEWLEERNIRWRVYSAGLSFFTLMENQWDRLLGPNFKRLPALSNDILNEPDATWPQVIFIEPDYGDSPVHLSGHACDNHPPLAVAFGESFLRQVYEALTSSPSRWQSMAAIVTYDEHGGFFDHVPPASVPSPVPTGASYNAPFNSTGVRVPAFVLSPLVDAGSTSNVMLDHTSILQLLAELFGREGEGYSPEVDARKQAGIASASQVLGVAPRSDVPSSPSQPIMGTAMLQTTVQPQTDQQKAFVAAIEALQKTHGAAATQAFPEIAHWLGS
jgi:phospholipase C